eukprot:406462-Prorocentrum_minimum.AAC.1
MPTYRYANIPPLRSTLPGCRWYWASPPTTESHIQATPPGVGLRVDNTGALTIRGGLTRRQGSTV